MTYTVFLTYNPKVSVEQATALRLQTIANLYGLQVELPDRIGATAKENTQQRISRAKYVIALPLQALTQDVKNELLYAIELGKTIIVVYDKRIGKTINFNNAPNVIERAIDFDNPNTDVVLHDISQFISQTVNQEAKNKEANNTILALLGIALGALALAAIFSDSKKS